MARIPEEKTKASVLRIMKIWGDRGIYEPAVLKDFENSYLKAWKDLHGHDFEDVTLNSGNAAEDDEEVLTPPDPNSFNSEEDKVDGTPVSTKANSDNDKNKTVSSSKRHHHSSSNSKRHSSSSGKHKSSHHRSSSENPNKRPKTKKEEIETALRKQSLEATNTIEEWEVDGVTHLEVKLSPSPYAEPPSEDDIIRMIKVKNSMLMLAPLYQKV